MDYFSINTFRAILAWFGNAIVLFVMLVPQALQADLYESETLGIGGSLRTYGSAMGALGKDPSILGQPLVLVSERARLKLLATPNQHIQIDLQLDGNATWLHGKKSNLLVKQFSPTTAFSLGIYRAYTSFFIADVDLRVGYQRIAWGSGLLFNPSNVFNHIQFGDPSQEIAGIPAILTRYPLGSLGELTVVGALRESSYTAQAGFQLVLHALQTDWGLNSAWDEDDDQIIVGWNIKGDAEVGYWSEGRWARKLWRHDNGNWHIESGLDYSFVFGDRSLYVASEYYYRSEGSNSINSTSLLGFSAAANASSSSDGLSGKHYFYPVIGFDVMPEIRWQNAALVNVTDPTAQVFSYVSFSYFDNFDLFAGVIAPVGKKGTEFVPDTSNIKVPGLPSKVSSHIITGFVQMDAHF